MAVQRFSKQKPYCRSCRVFLNLYEIDRMHVYICPRCDSKQVYLTELDKKVSKRTIAAFEALGKESQARSNIDCGICGKDMRDVQLADSKIHLDICLYCQAIWFGGATQEYERFLLEEISLKESTRDLLKNDRVGDSKKDAEFIAQNYNRLYTPLLVSHTHDRETDTNFVPHASGPIFVLMILVTFVSLKKPDIFMSLAHSNTASYGHQILTVFTSFFVHAGWSHLIGNCIFYYFFADNVERKVGTRKFLELLAYAQIANAAFFNFVHYGRPAYGVGASVGVAAIMAYYVSSDPYRPMRKILSTPRWGRGFRNYFNYVVLVFPAWLYLVVFTLYEFFGAHVQLQGWTRVSHMGHLVGILVGLLFFYVYPPSPEKTTDTIKS